MPPKPQAKRPVGIKPPVKRPAGRIAQGTLKNMKNKTANKKLAEAHTKINGPSEFLRIHNEAMHSRKPYLTFENRKKVAKIIQTAKKEAKKISVNEKMTNEFLSNKLLQEGITQETLRDYGFSYNDVKGIYGKLFDKRIFKKQRNY